MFFLKNQKDSINLFIFFILIAVSVIVRFNREMANFHNSSAPIEAFLSH